MSIFPAPLREDETLFSAVAQYGAEMNVGDWPAFVSGLFGYPAYLSPVLPYNLEHVAAHTAQSWGMDAIGLARLSTPMPYLCALASATQQESIVREVVRRPGGRKPTFLMKAIRRRRTLGFCPECVRSDRLSGTPPYWRCAHQLPGVLFCDRHRARLLEIPYSISRSAPWPLPPRFAQFEGGIRVSPETAEAWTRVALVSGEILRGIRRPSRESDRCEQILTLREAGHGLGRDRLHKEQIRQRFVEMFGDETLSALGLLPTPGGNWISARLSGHQLGLAPLSDVLLTVFCERIAGSSSTHSWPNCPSAYATHGGEHPVDERVRRGDRYYATCRCGFSFSYGRAPEGKPSDVEVNVYGPDYEAVARQRKEQGISIAQIARDLNVPETNVRRWVEEPRVAQRLLFGNALKDLLHDEWKVLLRHTGSAGASSRTNDALRRFTHRNPSCA